MISGLYFAPVIKKRIEARGSSEAVPGQLTPKEKVLAFLNTHVISRIPKYSDLQKKRE